MKRHDDVQGTNWAASSSSYVARASVKNLSRCKPNLCHDLENMEAIHFFRRLYSLDTLDTRLTTSTHIPLTNASDISPEKSTSAQGVETDSANLPPGALPSKWRTPEFCFYYAVFILVIPQMFKSVMNVSLRAFLPSYRTLPFLRVPSNTSQLPKVQGPTFEWMDSRSQSCTSMPQPMSWSLLLTELSMIQDNSDSQYSSFRDNIPYMAAVVLLHPVLRRFYNTIFPLPSASQKATPSAKDETTKQGPLTPADTRFIQRTSFDLYFALIFLAVLHGFSTLKILLILYINFKIATKLPKESIPTATWTFNIGILFVNEFCHGYHYVSVAKALFPFSASASSWGEYFDSYGGLIPRWEILFNFTILRLISFNMDYYWSLDRSRSSSPVEVHHIPTSSSPFYT
jgi:protein-cysteine N-palmitoyltransferase HHAT